MHVWDAFIHNGNREVADKNFDFALSHYEQALKQAMSMLHNNHKFENKNIVNMILISHCQLANCYFELKWIIKGCQQFEIAYQFLKSAITLSNDNHIQLSAIKATKQLKRNWLNSLQNHHNKLPDFNIIRQHSKNICEAFNIHHLPKNGEHNEIIFYSDDPFSFNY